MPNSGWRMELLKTCIIIWIGEEREGMMKVIPGA